MKVGEQLLYLAQLKGLSKNEAKKRIEIWFERLEIAGWWNKKVEELSKGMQQKIQFISTVVHEPKLVILDEPFSGFDPINAELIKNEVLRLNKEGTTFILSTHRMESVEQLCNNLVMINKSKVVLHGSVNQVRKDFKENFFEISYEGNVDWNGFDAHELEKTFEGFQRTKVKNQVGSNCNSIISRLMENNALIHEIKEVIPSMNDIFIKIVKG
jgi:ABC-2 type transport system ATP-binding protein